MRASDEARANFQILARFFRNDIDNAADSPSPIQRRCGAADNLDAFHVVHGDCRPVNTAIIGIVHGHAVIEDKDIRIPKAAHFNPIGCVRQALWPVDKMPMICFSASVIVVALIFQCPSP